MSPLSATDVGVLTKVILRKKIENLINQLI